MSHVKVESDPAVRRTVKMEDVEDVEAEAVKTEDVKKDELDDDLTDVED